MQSITSSIDIDKYRIVFTSKNVKECFDFATENYIRSVGVSIKKYQELVNLGVSEKKLLEFKNPDLY